jgi:putative membrane protein
MKKQTSIIWLSVIGVLIIGAVFWFGGTNPYDWGDYGMWPYGHGHMMQPGIGGVMLIFWALVLFGLILLVSWLSRIIGSDAGSDASRGLNAVEILKQRYAKGEIEKAEFESKLDDLTRPLPKVPR